MNRKEAYTALSDLIYKGFLTAELDLDGKLFVFKTVNEKEFDLIKMYSGRPDRPDYLSRFNNYFLLFSLFMAEDNNVLLNREKYVSELSEFFSSIPNQLAKKVISSLNDLRQAAYDSLRYIEGFCYTSQARNNWKALNGLSPTSSDFTGIPGTNLLGMNVHQESWVMINRFLDSEEDYNQKFYLALMISSSMNSKGAKHIRNQHETQSKNTEDRRKKLSEEGSMEEVKKKWSAEGWAVPTDTAEELVAELERQIHGVKDRHDVYVDEYMTQLKGEAKKRTDEAEQRIKKAQEDHDNVFIEGQQRALSNEEMQQLMAKNNLNPTVVTVPSEEAASLEDKDKFFKKIGTRVLTSRGI